MAVTKLLEKRRAEFKAEPLKPKEKTIVDPNQMPWQPRMAPTGSGVATAFVLPKGSMSSMNVEMHRRYVAILTNFLLPDTKMRFVYNDIELKVGRILRYGRLKKIDAGYEKTNFGHIKIEFWGKMWIL